MPADAAKPTRLRQPWIVRNQPRLKGGGKHVYSCSPKRKNGSTGLRNFKRRKKHMNGRCRSAVWRLQFVSRCVKSIHSSVVFVNLNVQNSQMVGC